MASRVARTGAKFCTHFVPCGSQILDRGSEPINWDPQGKRAFALGAFSAAGRYFRQALDLTPGDSRARPYLLLELAQSRAWAEEPGEEEALTARDALLDLGDIESAARAEESLSLMAFGRDGAAAAKHAERALELARDLPASRAKVQVLDTRPGSISCAAMQRRRWRRPTSCG